MDSVNLTFYSILDYGGDIDINLQVSNFIKSSKVKFPCMILIRNNGWNDYSFYSHFWTFFSDGKSNALQLGEVVILQSNAPDLHTTLPDEFIKLPFEKYFSKGMYSFYKNLNGLGIEMKNNILDSLNDVNYNLIDEKRISAIDPNLAFFYSHSLFRFDDYDFETPSEYASNSIETLNKIEHSLSSLESLDKESRDILVKLLYGSVVTALETYLGDAFKYHVLNNKGYFSSFLMNFDPPRGNKKYSIKDLGSSGDEIHNSVNDIVKNYLSDIIFHKLDYVNKLYLEVLNIHLPNNIFGFRDAVQTRHDIFHRSGKRLDGTIVELSEGHVRPLIDRVKRFIEHTESIFVSRT